MRLKDTPNVIDVRCHALIGAVEFASRPDAVGQRGAEIGKKAYELGLWCRNIGDSIVLSPPLIISESEIDDIFAIIEEAAKAAG